MHVAGAVGCPEAAVIEVEDIVEPVGEAGHSGWCAERGCAPVMAVVGSAAATGVSHQELRPIRCVAALLTPAVKGAAGASGSGPGHCWEPTPAPNTHPGPGLGAHLACTEHTQCMAPGVVGAHAALLHVTAVVRLQSSRWPSPSGLGFCHPLPEANPAGALRPQPHPPGHLCLPPLVLSSVGRLPPHPLSWALMGGSRRSGRSQPGPGSGCRGSPAAPPGSWAAAPPGSWAAAPPAPPRPGTECVPRPQGPLRSHRAGAKPVHGHLPSVPACLCGGNDAGTGARLHHPMVASLFPPLD